MISGSMPWSGWGLETVGEFTRYRVVLPRPPVVRPPPCSILMSNPFCTSLLTQLRYPP